MIVLGELNNRHKPDICVYLPDTSPRRNSEITTVGATGPFNLLSIGHVKLKQPNHYGRTV